MKKLFRGALLFFLLCAPLTNTTPAVAIGVTLNDAPISFDVSPVIENDRVLVPVRGILESLGYTVHWQEHTQSILALSENATISLQIDSSTATVNGKNVTVDAPAQIKDGRTFVPLRFLAEYSGAEVRWDGSSSTVSIYAATAKESSMKRSVVFLQTNKVQGSGIVLSADGLIATNYHVIENASTAQFIFSDGTIYQGEVTVVGLKPESDIALLRIQKNDLKPASVSESYSAGDTVSAVGSPYGNRNVLTNGVIRAYDRDYIYSTAAIFQGNSGGGLFDANGKLIGMTSAYTDEEYLSIPISQVLQVPQNLSIPLSQMKDYHYTPSAPQNLRVSDKNDGYTYISWSPVYGADYYNLYTASSLEGKWTAMKNPNRDNEKWYWGFPHCFGIAPPAGQTIYLQVSAVVDGRETPLSDVLELTS